MLDIMDELSREQMVKVLEEIKDIAKILKDVNDIVIAEQKEPSTPEDNVVFIVPKILRQFAEVQGTQMKLPAIILMYKQWAEELYLAVAYNKGHLKNKCLQNHLEQAYKVCKSLEKVLEGLKKT